MTRRLLLATRFGILVVLTASLVGACASGAEDQQEVSAGQGQSSQSASADPYLGFVDGADQADAASSFDDMAAMSDWVIEGTVVSVDVGREVEYDEGDVLHYAEVIVRVDREVGGALASEALESVAEPVEARLEFLLGDNPDLVDSFSAALPDGSALWYLHQKQGEGESGFYRLADLYAGAVAVEEDGTVSFPLLPREQPSATIPGEPHSEPVPQFPSSAEGVVTYDEAVASAEANAPR